MLKGFLPMLLASFLICWLIVVMQFLWQRVDELVGKGLDIWVILQIVFYASMYLVPMALPLGILLGSLMFFGNLGERLELLSMKASGMSLYRMMRPLFVAVFILAVGLFYFQNTVLITAQVRMWTLLYSARLSNPELEIPERVFYNEIRGYSIYVDGRDKKNPGRMLELMIYDHSQGSDKVRIMRADSGRIVMDEGKDYVAWRLYSGQSFENLEEPEYMSDKPIAHAQERFAYKEILIPFDANFQKLDESTMSSRFVGKNLEQLQAAFDSTALELDSIRSITETSLTNMSVSQRYSYEMPAIRDTTTWAQERWAALEATHGAGDLSVDSLMQIETKRDSLRLLARAISSLNSLRSEADNRQYSDQDVFTEYRTNGQEWHRKFTFPAACLVFFFIGAPLGAIIRKGGIGMPVVASVIFFIIYYIIDTFGYNMTKNESVPIWFGMWLSALVLFPIGLFLTYKASLDSNILNAEVYVNLWRKLSGAYVPLRVVEPITEGRVLDYSTLSAEAKRLLSSSEDLLASRLMNSSLLHAWLHGQDYQEQMPALATQLDTLVEELRRVDHPLILTKTNDLPFLPQVLAPYPLPRRRELGIILLPLLPLSCPLLLILYVYRERMRNSLRTMNAALSELIPLLEKSRERQ